MAVLPSGYKIVEFIESSGTQYINTQYSPTSNTTIEMQVELKSSSGTPTLWGVKDSTSDINNAIGVTPQNNTDVEFIYFGFSQTQTFVSLLNNLQVTQNKNILTISNISLTAPKKEDTIINNLFLLAMNSDGEAIQFAQAKIYSCKIYENNELVRNLIPCISPSDEIGLCDSISLQFYPNAGTGAFTAGPEAPSNIITISNIPSDLGEVSGPTSFPYNISNTLGLDMTITEKVDSDIVRTYTANSGDNQTFTIDISTLSTGSHTYTVDAEIADLKESVSGTFSLTDNVITIEGLPALLDSVKKNFTVKYVITDTRYSPTFNVVVKVDNVVTSNFTTKQSAVNTTTVDISTLNEGFHTLFITASGTLGSTTKIVEFFINKDLDGYISKSVRRLRVKINILNFQMQTVDEISGNVLDGNITEDANSDIRRTCDITMVVTNGQFDVQPGGQIFLDKYFQIYIGVDNLYTGVTQWFNKGIYLIDQPSYTFDPATSTLTFQGYDLMCKMTGLRNGYLEGIPTVIPQDSNIREAMIATVTQLGGFTKYSIQENPQPVPYDIQIDPGGTVYDILVALRDILPSWQIYFDEDGVFHYEPIPSGQNEPVMYYDDTWDKVVLSETIDTDFSMVKNVVEVWGKTLNPSHYADATVSGNIYQLDIADVSAYRKNILYGFTAPSIIENPQVQINSLGALPIVNEDGTNTVIPEAEVYYVVKYQEIEGENEGDPVTKNFLFMGYQQPYAVAEDDNPDSPFYVNGPIGKIRIVLQGGEYDNIYTNDLAMQRAEYELWTMTRLQDSVTLNCVPVYSLQTNTVVSKTLSNKEEPTLFIIKTITTNLSYEGTQIVEMITYYPLYPDI